MKWNLLQKCSHEVNFTAERSYEVNFTVEAQPWSELYCGSAAMK